MQYFDDMDSKYGFSDGEAIPEGAEVYRSVYIHALNTLLDAEGSAVRVVAWDRPGLHNWCLIVQVTSTYFYGTLLAADDGNRPCLPPEVQPSPEEYDAAYDAALDTARALGVDNCIHVTIQKDMATLFALLARGIEPH